MAEPLQHHLVNGRSGDPAVLLSAANQSGTMLLDLGDLHALDASSLRRVDLALVSHAHLDHLVGFDQLLRHGLGREATIQLLGPAGIAARIGHKLLGYSWDLAEGYEQELCFRVREVAADGGWRDTRFRLRAGFRAEPAGEGAADPDGVVLRRPDLAVRAAPLRHHRADCLGYALHRPARASVHRDRLDAAGLPAGPWLAELKRALLAGEADEWPVSVSARAGESAAVRPLGALRGLASVVSGQHIAYCTDLSDRPENRAAVQRLAAGADLLLIESAFAADDAALAARRGHLTTRAAGEMARAAGVGAVEAFHFSPRYAGEEARLLAEVAEAFAGG